MARISRRALEETADGPAVGKIPVVDTINGERVVRLIPWHQASRQHSKAWGETQDRWALPDPVEADVTAAVIDTLPPITRIPDRERYRTLCNQLMRDGLAFYQQHGYIRWPESVERELRTLGFRVNGYRFGSGDLAGQVEALAARYIVEAANHQKEQDSKQVTADHGRHYSA